MEGDHQWKTIGKPYLIGGLEHVFFSHHKNGNVIIPTDELTPSFFSGFREKTHARLLFPIIHHIITIYYPLFRVY